MTPQARFPLQHDRAAAEHLLLHERRLRAENVEHALHQTFIVGQGLPSSRFARPVLFDEDAPQQFTGAFLGMAPVMKLWFVGTENPSH